MRPLGLALATLVCSLFPVAIARAAPQDPPTPKTEQPAGQQGREFKWETGKITVKGSIATIDLPADWRYLQQQDARHVVEREWGNPPDPSTLGLVVPPGEADWAIIVSYDDEDGYVSDKDAAGLDFAALLKTMQDDSAADNAARKKGGYPTVDLLGWAEPPHYDNVEKKIYWAKALRFAGSPEPTLNYDVRVLGADGVLVMTAVAKVSELKSVAAGAKDVLKRTELSVGKRYADHDPSIHKVAAYGIGGLIAGKVLLKAGLFKVLLKPLIVVGVVLVGVAAKIIGKKKAAHEAT